MLTPEIAVNLRYERGLYLPVGNPEKYANPRLYEIAVRQKELFEELARLEAEIMEMAKKENFLKAPDDYFTSPKESTMIQEAKQAIDEDENFYLYPGEG